MKSTRRIRLGIALARDSMMAAWQQQRTPHSCTVPLDGLAEQSLTAAFAALRAEVNARTGAAHLSAHIALLPPLAEARTVKLPPLGAADARAVLARDGGRHFVGTPAPRALTVITASDGVHPAFVAAVSDPIAGQIDRAARAAGFDVAAIVPAHAAWLHAAGDAALVAVVHEGTLHLIQREGSHVAGQRRFAADAIADAAAAAGPAEGRSAAVFAPQGDPTAATLTSAGWNVGAPSDAVLSAARAAALVRSELVTRTTAAHRAAQSRRAARGFAVAAVLLLLAAAVLHLWGTQRELDAVRAQRAALRGEVGPLLTLRDSIDRVSAQVEEIERVAAAAPHWTPALFDIALLLPPGAYITRLFASGDTVTIDAEGARAGDVLQALNSAGTLIDARLLGSVQRELADGATAVERYRLTARLAPRTLPVTTDGAEDMPARAAIEESLRGGQ